MKLMQICFSPILNGAGGVEKVYCNMSNYFSDKFDVTNICCDNREGKPFFYLNERATFINLARLADFKVPISIKIWNEIVRLVKQIGIALEFPREVYIRRQVKNVLGKCITKERPDVIICYELRSMVAIEELGYDLSKVIVMFHSSADEIINSLSNKQRNVLKNVKYIQCLLQSDCEKMNREGFENVVCINNIVPRFENIGFDGRDNTIINVGRLNREQKRQHLLIEAFAKIAYKYPQWKVKLFGALSRPADYKIRLEKIIKSKKLENQVFLMGKTSNVPEELRKAAILGFPSAYEGFSLALTEAMASGLPSVGFKSAPSVNELIQNGHNGILCDDNVDSFAKALEELMTDEEKRIKYGTNAQKDMLKYAPEIVYGQWEALIKSMV